MQFYVTFDLETTGLSPDANEIIEIGAWKIKNGVAIEKFCHLVKPIAYIPSEIQRLTGITNEMVADACCIEELIDDFYQFCGDLPFLGHNLNFDYNFITTKGNRLGFDFTKNKLRCGIDTLSLTKQLFPNIGSYTLSDIAKYFNIYLGTDRLNFHRAEYDAYVTKLIYDRLINSYPNLPGVCTPQLLYKPNTKDYGRVIINDTLSFE